MITNWRELRDTLDREGAFSTFNTISHRGNFEETSSDAVSIPLVNSAESVKRSKKASGHFGNPTVNSVNSAESPPIVADDSWEWIEERSAIMEADGGISRDQADFKAFMAWFDIFIGGTSNLH